MKQKLIKTFLSLFSFAFAFIFIATPVSAGVDVWGDNVSGATRANLAGATGLDEKKDPRVIIANVIKIILGFLGIIAVILILLAGFKWMTAQGNEDQVTEAKTLLTQAVIGLAIILSAFAIATFVTSELIGITS